MYVHLPHNGEVDLFINDDLPIDGRSKEYRDLALILR